MLVTHNVCRENNKKGYEQYYSFIPSGWFVVEDLFYYEREKEYLEIYLQEFIERMN